ncbi:terpene synthase family protein [Streptomyces sp. NPDC001667]
MDIPLYMPYPAAFLPKAQSHDETAVEWLDAFFHGTGWNRNRALATQPGTLIGHIFPACTSEGLWFAARYLAWLFVIDDDAFDQAAGPLPPLARIVYAMEHPEARLDDHPLTSSIGELSRWVHAHVPADLHGPWVSTLEKYLLCSLVAADPAHGGKTWVDYFSFRPDNGACEATLVIGEISQNHSLHTSHRRHPDVRALIKAAEAIMMLGNDLYGYIFDTTEGTASLNAVHRMACTTRGLSEAVEEIRKNHDLLVHTFHHFSEHIHRQADDDLRAYIAMLRTWIRGALDWQEACSRYHTRPNEKPTIRVSDSWTGQHPDQRPVFAEMWWWDGLLSRAADRGGPVKFSVY